MDSLRVEERVEREESDGSDCYTEVGRAAGVERVEAEADEAGLVTTFVFDPAGLFLDPPSSRQFIALWRLFGKPFCLQEEQTCKYTHFSPGLLNS